MGKNRSVALIDEVTAGFSSSGEKVRGVAVLTSDKNQKIFRLSLINLAPVSGEGYFHLASYFHRCEHGFLPPNLF